MINVLKMVTKFGMQPREKVVVISNRNVRKTHDRGHGTDCGYQLSLRVLNYVITCLAILSR